MDRSGNLELPLYQLDNALSVHKEDFPFRFPVQCSCMAIQDVGNLTCKKEKKNETQPNEEIQSINLYNITTKNLNNNMIISIFYMQRAAESYWAQIRGLVLNKLITFISLHSFPNELMSASQNLPEVMTIKIYQRSKVKTLLPACLPLLSTLR